MFPKTTFWDHWIKILWWTRFSSWKLRNPAMFWNSGIILRDKVREPKAMAVLKILRYHPVSAQSETTRCFIWERAYTNKCRMDLPNYKVNYHMFDRIFSEPECVGICRSFGIRNAREVSYHVSRAPKTFTRNKLNVVFFLCFWRPSANTRNPIKKPIIKRTTNL